MADDHSFYSAETAMLCAHHANKIDCVGMPNDVYFDVLLTPFGNFCSWGEVNKHEVIVGVGRCVDWLAISVS